MESKLAFIMTNSGVLTLVVNNKSYTITTDHINYSEIKKCLSDPVKDTQKIEELCNVKKAVEAYTQNSIEIKDGLVYFNGIKQTHRLATRIVQFKEEGLPFEPLLSLMKNAAENVHYSASQQFYEFAEHHGMAVTEDGYLLAYKRVRNDWTDFYSGTFDNHVGNVVKMERKNVNDNRGEDCSAGLHVGSIEYVKGFNSDGHVIIVKVNPRDVVSVPASDTNKMRVCEYLVLAEYTGDLTNKLYDRSGKNPVTTSVDCNDDNDDDTDDDTDDERCEYYDNSENCGDYDCKWCN